MLTISILFNYILAYDIILRLETLKVWDKYLGKWAYGLPGKIYFFDEERITWYFSIRNLFKLLFLINVPVECI